MLNYVKNGHIITKVSGKGKVFFMNIRQSRILELLEKNERAALTDIKDRFDVSEMTIRRDLAYLEELGYVTRTRGGVVAKNRLFLESSFPQREKEHTEEKKAIAARAVELILPGENVILDTGTTTLYIARELVKTSIVLTVATTSLAVASALFNSSIDVLILGGFLRREIPDLTGPLTEKNLAEFHAHKLFIGCDGIIPGDGLYTSDLNISRIEGEMVKSAGKVIVVTDSSKFGKKSFVRYADIRLVHTVITDRKAEKKDVRALQKRGIDVILA
jgi:DeoR/GlpR family transcriptional regulator of sugar metabolism